MRGQSTAVLVFLGVVNIFIQVVKVVGTGPVPSVFKDPAKQKALIKSIAIAIPHLADGVISGAANRAASST